MQNIINLVKQLASTVPYEFNAILSLSLMNVFANFLDVNLIVLPTNDNGHKYYNEQIIKQ